MDRGSLKDRAHREEQDQDRRQNDPHQRNLQGEFLQEDRNGI